MYLCSSSTPERFRRSSCDITTYCVTFLLAFSWRLLHMSTYAQHEAQMDAKSPDVGTSLVFKSIKPLRARLQDHIASIYFPGTCKNIDNLSRQMPCHDLMPHCVVRITCLTGGPKYSHLSLGRGGQVAEMCGTKQPTDKSKLKNLYKILHFDDT